MLLISSRQKVTELHDKPKPFPIQHELEPHCIAAGIELFKASNIAGTDQEFVDTLSEYGGHALSLNLLAQYLTEYEESDIRPRTNLSALTNFPEKTRYTLYAFKVMAAYEKQLQEAAEL